MKAPEVPDKIYIQPSTIDELPRQNIVYTKRLSNTSIEYIRKDVLINWLKEHINDYLVHGRDIDLMFDDIKNAF